MREEDEIRRIVPDGEDSGMNMNGIARRWLVNSLGIILLILVVVVVVLSFVIRGSIYSSIQATLDGRSGELTNVFSGYGRSSSSEFNTVARNYVENFTDKEKMELMVFNSSHLWDLLRMKHNPCPIMRKPCKIRIILEPGQATSPAARR